MTTKYMRMWAIRDGSVRSSPERWNLGYCPSKYARPASNAAHSAPIQIWCVMREGESEREDCELRRRVGGRAGGSYANFAAFVRVDRVYCII